MSLSGHGCDCRKWGVLLILIFSISAVICTFTVYNSLAAAQWYVGFTSDLCDIANSRGAPFHQYLGAVLGGMLSVTALVVAAGWVML